MKYHLYDNWEVTVDLKILHKGDKLDFRFDFIVNSNESWSDIINTAKVIIEENFGQCGFEITQISLSTKQ